jgi:DNA-binding Lrp family transcriptional regulator
MQLVGQWNAVEQGLDPRWSDARVELAIEDGTQRSRALALLAPAGPGSIGTTIRFYVTRGGVGVGPEAVRRMLRRLDEEGIGGTLALVSSDEAAPALALARASLAADWDAAIGVLPADWSDLLCELELTSSDHVERAALLIAPVNPVQAATGRPGFRFRSAHTFGYGASSGMVRRCLARLDEDGIPGEVRIVRALSDTHPVATQGPVWYVGGKAV